MLIYAEQDMQIPYRQGSAKRATEQRGLVLEQTRRTLNRYLMLIFLRSNG